jgi:hypothetical protein
LLTRLLKRDLVVFALHSDPYHALCVLVVDFFLSLIEMFRKFVSPQKACDKEAGLDLLKKFESMPVKETREFGFSLVETAMILLVIVDHERSINEMDKSLKVLCS